MLKILKTRLKQGHQTLAFPPKKKMPDRFCGVPEISAEKCVAGCDLCLNSCPCGAITVKPLTLDLGRCMFCEECVRVCPHHCIRHSTDLRMSTTKQGHLKLCGKPLDLAKAFDKKTRTLFGRSLKLRVVTAGSCNGCEMELTAIENTQFDISRFGIQIVASPRHADGLIVTGPVTDNMKLALEKTYAAVASPKIVIALGACAISGGPFTGSKHIHNGAANVVPVDLFIAGCPPHPMTIIEGIMRVLGKIS
ncbi:MAG: NADH-quinone oxidoreductase subunit NuoB [Deltaproteobacteria bacterium]|nr:NADH-quinone oxidoreductase subunit NuoB [Deltaproteobacteria bacterium]